MPNEINLITKIENVRKSIRQHREELKKLKEQYDLVTIDIQKDFGKLEALTEIKETGIFKIIVPDTTSQPFENVETSSEVVMTKHEHHDHDHDHGHSHGHGHNDDHREPDVVKSFDNEDNENNVNHMGGKNCNCPDGEDCNCDDKAVGDWDDSEYNAPIVPLNDLYTQFKIM